MLKLVILEASFPIMPKFSKNSFENWVQLLLASECRLSILFINHIAFPLSLFQACIGEASSVQLQVVFSHTIHRTQYSAVNESLYSHRCTITGSSEIPVLLLEHVDSLPWWQVSGYRRLVPQEQSRSVRKIFINTDKVSFGRRETAATNLIDLWSQVAKLGMG